MNKLVLFLLLVSVFFVVPLDHPTSAQEDPTSAQDEQTFKVIINAKNPTISIERAILSKIFLKKVKRWNIDQSISAVVDEDEWDKNQSITPVDQDQESTVRESFTREIHRKSVSAIKSFWQRMIFSGRDVPPTELDSDAEVLAFVAGDPGAVGYVSRSADLSDRVKELTISE